MCRALQFVAPRTVGFARVDPGEPRPGEVFVRTLYSGISGGTEILAYRGHIDPDLPLDERLGSLGGTFSYPFRYGYSCVGVVERSDGDVQTGTQVFCFHPHQESLVCPASDVVPVEGVDARLATMFPLVETALQVVLDAGPLRPQEVVVVAGLGVVGLLAGALLRRDGARVVGSDPNAGRRRVAAGLGIESAAPGELNALVRSATAGQGARVVVEASGNPAALAGALDLLAHEGEVVVASWYGNKAVTLPLGRSFHRRRLTIRSSQVSTIPRRLAGHWTIDARRTKARALLDELPLQTLATHEFPFSDAARAYAALDEDTPDIVHAALCYEAPA